MLTHTDDASNILDSSGEIVHQMVEERHNRGLTQLDMAELTGMMASNIAHFENLNKRQCH